MDRYSEFLLARKNEMHENNAATNDRTTKALPSLPAQRCSPMYSIEFNFWFKCGYSILGAPSLYLLGHFKRISFA